MALRLHIALDHSLHVTLPSMSNGKEIHSNTILPHVASILHACMQNTVHKRDGRTNDQCKLVLLANDQILEILTKCVATFTAILKRIVVSKKCKAENMCFRPVKINFLK